MVELLEHAAHVATDPKRVYYLGAGGNSPQCAQGLHFLFSNETLPQTVWLSAEITTCSTV
jgi:hypothetical protein